MPALADLDPLDFAWALSRVSLLDYAPESGFRYRLAGGEPSAVFGHGNLKGLTFRDLMSPEGARIVEERWLPVVTERSICCMTGMVYLAAEQTAIGERIVLPLASRPDGPVDCVLGMTVCHWTQSDTAKDVQLSRCEYIPVSEIP